MVSVTAAVQGVVWVLVLTVVTLYAMGILTTRLRLGTLFLTVETTGLGRTDGALELAKSNIDGYIWILSRFEQK